jgi:hypothetical protein
MLETLPGLNFFLAVVEVLGSSLALGRLLCFFTQLGVDLRAHLGSATKTSLEAESKTHVFGLLFFLCGLCLASYFFFLGLRL